MIHGVYLDTLNDIYTNYKNKFIENKFLLKDSSPKTIQTFMQNFMEITYLSQIKNCLSYDNLKDFVNSFFDEFYSVEELEKSENELQQEDNFEIKNIFQNKEELLFLKLFFFENCLIIFKLSERCHPGTYSEILNHFFNILIKKFETKEILLNLDLFNFILKNVILITLKSTGESNFDVQTLYQDSNILIDNENKRILINFLFLNKLLGVNSDHGNFELEPHHTDFINKTFSQDIHNFVNLLLGLKSILHLNLSSLGESQIMQINNHVILIFKKLFNKMKKEKFFNSYKKFIEKFLHEISLRKIKISDYEQYVFIFDRIFDDIFVEEKTDERKFNLLTKILKSNQPVLHKLSVNILEKIRSLKIIDNFFIDKFISIFDVLDGYNSHLFKGLWKEFESVILFCENYKERDMLSGIFSKNKNEKFNNKNNSELLLNIREIFSNPFTYFLIISKKIKNHENVRIQKFYIKSFSNFCVKNNLSNPNFEIFIYSTLIKMLNNPLFYPENESISYHAKIGITIENFYSFWLGRNLHELQAMEENNLINTNTNTNDSFSENLSKYLKAIVDYIKISRILVYLINAINKVFSKSNFENKFCMNNNILESIVNLLDHNIKYLSIYQKQKSWETIDLILRRSNLSSLQKNNHNLTQIINSGFLLKIFYYFIQVFIVKENSSYMSIEGVNLMDNKNFVKFSNLIKFFVLIFSECIVLDNLDSDDIGILLRNFQNNNLCLKIISENFNKNEELISTLFWFLLIANHQNEKCREIYKNFLDNAFNKLTSYYVSEDVKVLIMNNLSIMIKLLDIFYIKLNKCNSNENNEYNMYNFTSFHLNELSNFSEALVEFNSKNLTDNLNLLNKSSNLNNNISITVDESNFFFIKNYKILDEISQKSYELSLKVKQNLLLSKLNNINEKILISSIDTFNLSEYVLDENKIKIFFYVTSLLKDLQIKLTLTLHHQPKVYREYFNNAKNLDEYFNTISLLSQFMNHTEILFEKNPKWMKENSGSAKEFYNQVLFNIIKIKTLILMQLKDTEKEINIINLIDIIFNNSPSDYSYRIFEFLEKSNEENIFFIFKLISLYLHFYSDKNLLNEDFLNLYVKFGLKTLTEKRENLNYINTKTFLSSFINKKVVKSNPQLFIPIISNCLNTLFDLNEKRTWLVLKLGSDLFFEILEEKENFIFVEDLIPNILDLAESKETRGEDTYMLQTNPEFLFSPFNISSLKIFKNNLVEDEEIYKYGLSIRLRTLNFFDEYIKNLSSSPCDLFLKSIEIILNLMQNILEVIDANTAQKTEMQFTSKHRKKLRLSQFLIILSQIFEKININTNQFLKSGININYINTLENILMKVFEKVNLYSVRFYFDLTCLNYAKYSISFLNYLISVLKDPNAKTHCVTSSLIILSIMLLEEENLTGGSDSNSNQTCLTQEIIQKIYETITSLCTSNICNIRGFAQYFLYRLRNKLVSMTEKNSSSNNNLHLIEKINISEFFYEYLSKSPNIQRFFTKFDENYKKYTELVRNLNVENVIKNNFDMVNCEIMPLDFINDFKEMALDMVEFENEDLTKQHISWRVFEEEKSKNIKSDKMEICLPVGDNTDFQKKYRPIEETNMKKKKRLDVIVMASLIDKAPNLGGLARTCEVFNIGAMTINSETFLNDRAFLTAAASAERWLPILNLPTLDIERFIRTHRKLGYKIIGLEQTSNSIPLKEFKFTEKCVIVLGNEKEGIPQNLIQLIDYCVIIPQFGEIRSLNVHVSAALMLWELVNNCLVK
jgi:tRNA G18 (ribose-2'-O)-methylase SpoU